jgi:Protein of unknown function (DUF1592)/Protein of unknown function (DUF1588)/Protein of unknown function (DUF1585)/Protein of unknown function (DUF1587)/Protein of unknown function (DUF1595)/Planctomycete cytochrome C
MVSRCAVRAVAAAAFFGQVGFAAQAFPEEVAAFTDRHCSSCHNDVDKEGNLDLTSLKYNPAESDNFLTWVKVHDRVRAGEMPPKEKKRPEGAELSAFVKGVSTSLIAAEEETTRRLGRATRRRLNRTEYENSLRDLLQAPWLLIRDQLPEDGESAHFNKVSRALDVSYVHMSRYMGAADYAMRQVLSVKFTQPPTTVRRFWARDNFAFTNQDGNPDRGRFPILNSGPDIPALTRMAPLTVGESDPQKREQEAMAWTASHFQTGFQSSWNLFRAPVTGQYNIKFSGYSIWVGPNGTRRPTVSYLGITPKDGDPRAIALLPSEWHRPNHADVAPGRRSEPVHVYAKVGATAASRIAQFDLTPEPTVYEFKNIMLMANQNIIMDAVRFFRSRPGFTAIDHYTNKLAQRDGMPGVAFRWMDVEGPLYNEETNSGYKFLFGDLPLKKAEAGKRGVDVEVLSLPAAGGGRGGRGAPGRGGQPGQQQLQLARGGAPVIQTTVEVDSANPEQDADRLIRAFLARAYRRPVDERDAQRFLTLFKDRHTAGLGFAGSMLASYTAILASQEFVYLDEKPGRLDDYALATRLALFLWNSEPDLALRERAAKGELHRPEVLRAETDRMLNDPKSERMVEAFLDYWLEVRKMYDTTPDIALHNDYYLDDALLEASVDESRLFFAELLKKDMPARNIVDSDFTYLNDRLALHYGIPGVEGAKMRRVALPTDSVRGGVMTQAIVLKVTANGTTTSPVLRGKWIMERVVGYDVPAPPAAVPAVEPDIRGAVTIRQQLDKHRADESCASCHRKIDPPGFALEAFDVMGAWRDRYRAVAASGQTPERGFGQNGWPLAFYYGLPVDSSGATAEGLPFKDVRELKQLLLQDEEGIARNFAKQLSVFATGAPVRFSDRAKLDQILSKTAANGHGVRSILNELVHSELFLNK